MPESVDESDSDDEWEEEPALDELTCCGFAVRGCEERSISKGGKSAPFRPFLRVSFVLYLSLFLLRFQDLVRSSGPFGKF